MKRKFAFFDVDKTILERDSMQDLLFFAWKVHPLVIIPSCISILFSVLLFFLKGHNDIRILKNGVFYVVRFLNDDELKYFAREILLKQKSFKNGLDEIRLKKSQGFIVALVSASPECYLKYFDILEVDKIIGTQLDSKGKIVGENCKHNEKVKRIDFWLQSEAIEIDYENSFAYSDSLSADQPMLELVSNRYLINSDLRLPDYKNLYWK